ncbi:MAG: hypothetical protein QXL18_04440 [Candidatus Woesearchaeota archaeon]
MNFGSDIKLDNWDLSITYGDFEIVRNKDCFLQQLIYHFNTPKGSYFYAPEWGSRLYQFLHANINGHTLIDYEISIKEVLEAEPLVINDSIEIKVEYENETLKAKVYFETVDDTQYNLIITAGKELKIWEE